MFFPQISFIILLISLRLLSLGKYEIRFSWREWKNLQLHSATKMYQTWTFINSSNTCPNNISQIIRLIRQNLCVHTSDRYIVGGVTLAKNVVEDWVMSLNECIVKVDWVINCTVTYDWLNLSKSFCFTDSSQHCIHYIFAYIIYTVCIYYRYKSKMSKGDKR